MSSLPSVTSPSSSWVPADQTCKNVAVSQKCSKNADIYILKTRQHSHCEIRSNTQAKIHLKQYKLLFFPFSVPELVFTAQNNPIKSGGLDTWWPCNLNKIPYFTHEQLGMECYCQSQYNQKSLSIPFRTNIVMSLRPNGSSLMQNRNH